MQHIYTLLLAICLNAAIAMSSNVMLPPLTPVKLGNHKINVRGGGVDGEGALAGLKKGWEVSAACWTFGRIV
jgi:hypothetical protein